MSGNSILRRLNGLAVGVETNADGMSTFMMTGIDPVFKAIAKHRIAKDELVEAGHACDAIWEQLPREAKERPYVVAGGSTAFSHDDIDELVDTSIAQIRDEWSDDASVAELEKLRTDKHAKLEAQLEIVAGIYREFGYTAVNDRYESARTAELGALRAVCRIVPTTLMGAATLANWLNENFDDQAGFPDMECLTEALGNVRHAIRTFGAK